MTKGQSFKEITQGGPRLFWGTSSGLPHFLDVSFCDLLLLTLSYIDSLLKAHLVLLWKSSLIYFLKVTPETFYGEDSFTPKWFGAFCKHVYVHEQITNTLDLFANNVFIVSWLQV